MNPGARAPRRARGRRLLVALTGSIGGGKSAALAAFARLGAATASCDAAARELSSPGGPVHRALVRAFGRGVLLEDGAVDRRLAARAVFSQPRRRRLLERLSHPPILRRVRARLRRSKAAVAVADVPLYFEARAAGRRGLGVDAVIAVTAPRETRIRRVMRRDGLARTEVEARIRAQLPERAKASLADAVIDNGGSRADLARSVRDCHQALRLIAHGGCPSAARKRPKGGP